MQIQQYDNIGHSPAWAMIKAALTNLDNEGFGFQPEEPPSWNDAALIAVHDNGGPMGFMSYRHNPVNESWFVLLAYVVPHRRRQGIHTAMFGALVERAKAKGILSIHCGTHVNNKSAQAAFEAQGRRPVAIMYEYVLKEWADGDAI